MPQIIGHGGERDPFSLNLETRAGWRIPNELRELEQAEPARDAAAQVITSQYTSAEVLSTSALYNCAGLAFGSRRVNIDVADSLRILDDDGYAKLAGPEDAAPGDIVLYRDRKGELAHVAVVHKVQPVLATGDFIVTVVSAWGQSGEYLHEWDDVQPLLGSPAEIWSKRI